LTGNNKKLYTKLDDIIHFFINFDDIDNEFLSSCSIYILNYKKSTEVFETYNDFKARMMQIKRANEEKQHKKEEDAKIILFDIPNVLIIIAQTVLFKELIFHQ
jgi:hypothetical protein